MCVYTLYIYIYMLHYTQVSNRLLINNDLSPLHNYRSTCFTNNGVHIRSIYIYVIYIYIYVYDIRPNLDTVSAYHVHHLDTLDNYKW